MDFHYNRWHLFCQSVFLFLYPFLSKIPAASHARRRRFVFFVQSSCSGGNLPPTGPEGRNRGTFVSVTSQVPAPDGAGWRWVNAATSGLPLDVPGVAAATCRHPAVRPLVGCSYSKHSTGPAPRRGWLAMNHRRYIGFTVRRTGCSGGKPAAIGRKATRWTFVSGTSNGASPWRGWSGDESSPLHWGLPLT